jgi:hypothetical protein
MKKLIAIALLMFVGLNINAQIVNGIDITTRETGEYATAYLYPKPFAIHKKNATILFEDSNKGWNSEKMILKDRNKHNIIFKSTTNLISYMKKHGWKYIEKTTMARNRAVTEIMFEKQ